MLLGQNQLEWASGSGTLKVITCISMALERNGNGLEFSVKGGRMQSTYSWLFRHGIIGHWDVLY